MSYPDFTQQNQMMMNNGMPMQNPYYNAQPWMAQNWTNPYMSRQSIVAQQQMNQQQMQQSQPQQQIQSSNLIGRFVGGLNEIAVNEVDMNGTVSIFPMNDMSCIFAKQWTADGKIQTVKYIPVQEEGSGNSSDGRIQTLQFDYAPINERFDRLEQLLTPKTTSRAKKGDADNE